MKELAALVFWLGRWICEGLVAVGLSGGCASASTVFGTGVLAVGILITIVVTTFFLSRRQPGR